MKLIRTFFIAFFLWMFIHPQLMAQQELTLYFSKKIANSNTTNPVNFNSNHTVVSFPSISLNYGNNAFSYNDLFRTEDGTTYLDLDDLVGQLEEQNILQLQLSAEILSIYFNVKKIRFHLSSSERANIKFAFSDKLLRLAWQGNAQFVGQEVDIDPVLDFTLYREWSLGMAYDIGKLSFGHRFRFLSGRANISTKNDGTTFLTDNRIFKTSVATDYRINTAGLENSNADQLFNPFGKNDNPGFAMDLGLAFQPNEKWTFSASVLDLGKINWKKDPKNYLSKGEFAFEGLQLNQYLDTDTFNFDDYIDSIQKEFDPEITYQKYSKSLTPRMYIALSRQLNKKQTIGILGYGEFFNQLKTAFSLYHGFSYTENSELGLSYSIKNQLYNHFGLSIAQRIGRVQLYFVSDDIINTFVPLQARNVNFRFGMNFYLGKGEAKKELPTEDEG